MVSSRVSALLSLRSPWSFSRSDSLPGAVPGSPGPLEIEAAKVAGNVNHFTDPEQARHFSTLHCLSRELIRVDAARGDLGFRVAFRSGRNHLPRMRSAFHLGQRRVRPAEGCVYLYPAI